MSSGQFLSPHGRDRSWRGGDSAALRRQPQRSACRTRTGMRTAASSGLASHRRRSTADQEVTVLCAPCARRVSRPGGHSSRRSVEDGFAGSRRSGHPARLPLARLRTSKTLTTASTAPSRAQSEVGGTGWSLAGAGGVGVLADPRGLLGPAGGDEVAPRAVVTGVVPPEVVALCVSFGDGMPVSLLEPAGVGRAGRDGSAAVGDRVIVTDGARLGRSPWSPPQATTARRQSSMIPPEHAPATVLVIVLLRRATTSMSLRPCAGAIARLPPLSSLSGRLAHPSGVVRGKIRSRPADHPGQSPRVSPRR